MKTYSLSEIKNELVDLSPKQLTEICLKLARMKKDNKDYLAFLLFSASDKGHFVSEVKADIEKEFEAVKQQSVLYYTRKTLRKILRIVNRYCKFVDSKPHVIEMRIHYLQCIKNSEVPYWKSRQLTNLYQAELMKVQSLIETLHEDLRGDYAADMEKISV